LKNRPRKIAIVDYGVGNLASITNALRIIGADSFLCSKAEDLEIADRVILPGVGSFPEGMENLCRSGLDRAVVRLAMRGRPILGICLGMQLLAAFGEEFELTAGLNLLPGRVTRLKPAETGLRLPHVGWNEVSFRDGQLTAGLGSSAAFYFVHSFAFDDAAADYVTGLCDYGGPVVSTVEKGNIFGVQFHPEKSQKAGLAILENFVGVC
jgi:glutamine amidotransferase